MHLLSCLLRDLTIVAESVLCHICQFLLYLNLHLIFFLHRLSSILFFFGFITLPDEYDFVFFVYHICYVPATATFIGFPFFSMFVKLNPLYINPQGTIFFVLLYAWESNTISWNESGKNFVIS